MEAHEAAFTFMGGAICIEVPFFQRPYVWNDSNWRELMEDLFDDKSSHFLGSIILKSLKPVSGEQPRWSLIDGQQRLTTLSILLRACFDELPLDNYSEDEQKRAKFDMESMLTYRTKKLGGETRLKINHSRVDSDEFTKVIMGDYVDSFDDIVLAGEEKKGAKPSHGILQCYKFFRKNLDAEKADYLWGLLLDDNAKTLVKIDLLANENEQAIFDTVNSAGVRLTCADTIKNSLFQGLMECATEEDEREKIIRFYEETWEKTFADNAETIDYWAKIRSLGRINRDNLEILLHCVALIKGIYDPDVHKISDLPDVYKDYIKDLPVEQIEELIELICDYAKTFRHFFYTFDEKTSFEFDQPVVRLFHILDVCDISTFHAYILKVLKGYETCEEDEIPQQVLDELRNLEKIALRYTVCKVSTKNFNKNCAELIAGKIKTDDLLAVEGVSDDSLRTHLRSIGNKQARLILFWIELKKRLEETMCPEKDLKYVYTLEHVMPQKWQQFWPIGDPTVVNAETGELVVPDEAAEDARSSAVYEIGNMALLGSALNTSLRNYDFKRKVNGEGRKKGMKAYAALLLTRKIVEDAEEGLIWNEQAIRNRTNELTDQVLAIW